MHFIQQSWNTLNFVDDDPGAVGKCGHQIVEVRGVLTQFQISR